MRIRLEGDVPSPVDPHGLPLRTRCWKAQDCAPRPEPPLVDKALDQRTACHFAPRITPRHLNAHRDDLLTVE
jgi:hypothetical protein